MQLWNKKTLQKVLIGAFWLFVWQIVAWCVHNKILFASPLLVCGALWEDVFRLEFYVTIGLSLIQILTGLLAAFLWGVLLGILAHMWGLAEQFLTPLIAVLKAIPVVSFVVILLVAFGSKHLAFFISFLVVFPGMYESTRMGLQNVNQKNLEMAKLYKMPVSLIAFYVYRPAVIPFWISHLKSAVGMSFKSGVAAQVIGTPAHSIGEKMYMAKIHLETPHIFSWTLITILCAYGVEKGCLFLLKQWENCEKPCFFREESTEKNPAGNLQRLAVGNKIRENVDALDMSLKNISKYYGDNKVIEHFNWEIVKGRSYCIMAPSGEGKTTLLHILAGFIPQDHGEICNRGEHKISMVFQENRLFTFANAVDNVWSVTGKSKEYCGQVLGELLDEQELEKPVGTFSGGMMRRVEIVKAMLADSDMIFMDEPFAGLDVENKERVVQFIKRYQKGRTLIISTHDESDLEAFEATKISI